MAITTYAGEKRVSDIATRVFGDLPPAQLKVAEEALLQANPHLEALKTVKPGAVLIVPQVPGIKPKRAASSGDHPAADGVTLVARTLALYQRRLAEAAGGEQQEVKNTTAILKSADVKRLVARFQLQSQVAQIDAANKQRDAFAAETGTFAKKTIAEIQKDLEDLIARIG